METSEAENFSDELKWCINQLELGLLRQSPDSRQAQETMKIVKILRSSKAPLIKKRQAMRNALGDYRKKMKDEEKKSLNAMKHSKFKSFDNMKVYRKSKFLRQSHRREIICEQQNEDNEFLSMNMNNLNLQQHFSPELSSSQTTPCNVLSAHGSSTSQISTIDGENQAPSAISCNGSDNGPLSASCNVTFNGISQNNEVSSCFKFCPSDNSFSFNFDAENECLHTNKDVANEETEANETKATEIGENSLNDNLHPEVVNELRKNHFKFEKSDNLFTFNFSQSE